MKKPPPSTPEKGLTFKAEFFRTWWAGSRFASHVAKTEGLEPAIARLSKEKSDPTSGVRLAYLLEASGDKPAAQELWKNLEANAVPPRAGRVIRPQAAFDVLPRHERADNEDEGRLDAGVPQHRVPLGGLDLRWRVDAWRHDLHTRGRVEASEELVARGS